MGLALYVTKPERITSMSYGNFHSFREDLAKLIGFDIDKMVGFAKNGNGKPWPARGDEPLVELLDHSDCDGSLDYEACARIAPRLRAVVKALPEDNWTRATAERLADAMDEAAESCGEVLFR